MNIILTLTFIFTSALLHTTYAAVFYSDPVDGSMQNSGGVNDPFGSLQEIIESDFFNSQAYAPLPYDSSISQLNNRNPQAIIQPGDTLMLMNGLHGEAVWRNFINDKPITIMAYDDHTPIIEWIGLYACRNWNFENIEISSEPYGNYENRYLVHVESNGFFGPSALVTFKNCTIYSSAEPWMTPEGWIENASEGMFLRADSLSAVGNTIVNTSFGLTAMGNHILADNNEIINFSADGMRIVGSHITFSNNLIKNCYDVDENHDDGIQSWAEINGVVSDHNTVIGNTIINSDDYTRPLNGPLQGIGCFDGMYNDWLVANNVISVNHWHGITFLGARRCTIIHNTVLDPTPLTTPGASWIRIADHKDGRQSSDCLVANNVTNDIVVDGTLSQNVILNNTEDYNTEFVDYANNNFQLSQDSKLIDAADTDYSIEYDILGYDRFIDNKPDVGAFEFQKEITSTQDIIQSRLILYPNPFTNQVMIDSEVDVISIEINDINGILIANGKPSQILKNIDRLPHGLYVFNLYDSKGTSYHHKMVKL